MVIVFAMSLQRIALISIAVIGWLFCAFYTAETANSYGADYTFWLLLGILTGPLSVPLAVLYFRLSGERYRRRRYSVDGKSDLPRMVRCLRCGEMVPESFERCQFCGAPIKKRTKLI